MKQVTTLLKEHNVLYSYRSLTGVELALHRIADRAKGDTPLSTGIDEVLRLESSIDATFLSFFDELYEEYYIED